MLHRIIKALNIKNGSGTESEAPSVKEDMMDGCASSPSEKLKINQHKQTSRKGSYGTIAGDTDLLKNEESASRSYKKV